MEENNITLKDLIVSYNELTISEKRRELGREITELSLVIQKLLSDLAGGLPIDNTSLEEFDNLFDATITENDYLTGLYEDIVNFKELLGIYLSKTILEDNVEDII